MAELIIEELNRLGHVTNRYKIEKFPVQLGRGFDSDIILDDPYVSPHHVTIEASEAGWRVNDEDSLNGVVHFNKLDENEVLTLVSGDEIILGKTRLRFYSPQHEIKETRHISHGVGYLAKLAKPLPLMLILLVYSLILVSEILITAQKKITIENGLEQFIPYAIALMVWAAVWAFVGRIIRHQSNYFIHLTVIVIFAIVMMVFEGILQILSYNLLFYSFLTSVEVVFISIALVWLLSSHLRYSTALKKEVRLIGAAAFGAGIIGLYFLTSLTQTENYKFKPEYSTILKPPYARIVGERTVDQFIADSQKIFEIEIRN